jgi:hypothetical protein
MKMPITALALILLSSPAFAAKLEKISSFSNSSLEKVYRAAGKDLYSASFKVVKATPANGRSAAEVRLKTVAQAAHLLCSFFDDGVDIAVAKSASSAVAGLDLQDNDAEVAALTDALSGAGKSVEIYSGTAGGNNTYGTVVGAYDRETSEVLVLSSTNCGSDD